MSRFTGRPMDGLPGRLPPGEDVLWQGAPHWRSLATKAFRVKIVAVYFGALILWRVIGASMAGHSLSYAAASGASSILLGAISIGIFCMFSWAIARTTTYTITTNRVVITYGMALPKSLNLPYASIDGADLRINADGTGDIALKLPAKKRLSYLLLWPHVRAGAQGRSQPVLRCIAAPRQAAAILTEGLAKTLANTERALVSAPQPAEPEMLQAQAA